MRVKRKEKTVSLFSFLSPSETCSLLLPLLLCLLSLPSPNSCPLQPPSSSPSLSLPPYLPPLPDPPLLSLSSLRPPSLSPLPITRRSMSRTAHFTAFKCWREILLGIIQQEMNPQMLLIPPPPTSRHLPSPSFLPPCL